MAAADPLSGMASAGIQGAAGLIGGLFSLQAEKKRRQLEALKQGLDQRVAAESGAAKTLGDQTPFAQLMNSYNFLGR